MILNKIIPFLWVQMLVQLPRLLPSGAKKVILFTLRRFELVLLEGQFVRRDFNDISILFFKDNKSDKFYQKMYFILLTLGKLVQFFYLRFY